MILLFFEQYSRMPRSVNGLAGAGEWHILRKLLPDFTGRRVLDLGCGFGWHCLYAAEQGAASVVGIDISQKMIREAKKKNHFSNVQYYCMSIEDFDFQPDTFDIVISSLAFHYLNSLDEICRNVYRCLSSGGSFIFSVEHPVFTAYGNQEWIYNEQGERSHWPVDRYFEEGIRNAIFLGQEIQKYHKTIMTYINTPIKNGFELKAVIEPEPDTEAIEKIPGMKDELRRPIFLIISAMKRE